MNRAINIALHLSLSIWLLWPNHSLEADDGTTPATTLENESKSRIALVLAGGGARGLAHIGVIRYLEEQGVPVDIVCGTSMGALIGGLWSLGWSGPELDSLARRIDWVGHFSDTPTHNRLIGNARFLDRPAGLRLDISGLQIKPPGQVFLGNKVELLLSDLTQGAHGDIEFDKLPRAFACATTDLEAGCAVHLHSGSLPRALRASMSLPSLLEPVVLDGRVLVDGGLVQNLPTDLALRMGADLILAVDLPVHLKQVEDLDNLLAVAEQSRQILSLSQEQQAARLADFILRPDVSRYGLLDFEDVDSLIQRGYEAASDAWPDLRGVLKSRGVILRPEDPLSRRRVLSDTLWLASLTVEGNSSISLEQAERLLGLKRGDRFSPRMVSRRVRNFISAGLATRAGYEIVLLQPDAPLRSDRLPSAGLILQVEGPSRAWLDINPGYNELDKVWMGLRWEWNHPRGPGSRVRLESRFGEETRHLLEAWQSSFLNSGLYLHPYASFSSLPLSLKGEGSRSVASYDLDRAVLGLGSGVVLRRGSRLEGALTTEWHKASPVIADSSWVRLRDRTHAVLLRADVDTRNSMDLPTHGFTLAAETRLHQPVGRDDGLYSLAFAEARLWHALSFMMQMRAERKHATAVSEVGSIPYRTGLMTIESGAMLGRNLRGELPLTRAFTLGGWPQMPGMDMRERWVPRLASGWVGLRVWLNRTVSVMPVVAMAHTDGDWVLGGARNDLGLGVELAARTLLGPLRVAAGNMPGESWAFYLRFGWE